MINKKILILVSLLLVSFLLVSCMLPELNKEPLITSDPVETATVGEVYTYDVDATDPNTEDVLTYSLTDGPSDMEIDATSGKITWTPDTVGDFDVAVVVSDEKGLSDAQIFTIVVSPPLAVNQPPIIYSTPGDKAIVGVPYTYDVEATDPDGDDLTYSLTVKPEGMVVNSATGVISWIPTFDQVGNNLVTVKVSDGALCDTQDFTITVRELELELTGIVVDPKEMTLFVGGTESITSVTATYEIRGTEVPIALGDCTFESDDEVIVTVSNVGLVTAVAEGVATITVSYGGEADTVEVTVNPVLPGELAAEDFGYYINDSHPCGYIAGYSTGWGLTDATFKGIESMVVKLYSEDTLLQTNTATARVGIEGGLVVGVVEKTTSSFDIFGEFDYVCDGYWINVRESEYGGSLYVTRVVATVTLANGKILTAENTLEE